VSSGVTRIVFLKLLVNHEISKPSSSELILSISSSVNMIVFDFLENRLWFIASLSSDIVVGAKVSKFKTRLKE